MRPKRRARKIRARRDFVRVCSAAHAIHPILQPRAITDNGRVLRRSMRVCVRTRGLEHFSIGIRLALWITVCEIPP
jgi:hypothetical protein